MRKLTLGGVNGNEVDAIVRCQFCGGEMKQGSCSLGAGTNVISFACECGAVANFAKNYSRKIVTTEMKFNFED